MSEEWKFIPDTDDLYSVSNLGRVRREEKPSLRKNGTYRTDKTRILRQYKDHGGYLFVRLSVKAKIRKYTVHRLVCMAFLGESDRTDVNHKNFVRDDNRLENLEWVTRRENSTHRSKKRLTGAYWNKRDNFYFSRIVIGERRIELGKFNTEIEAHRAYLNALEKYGIENRYAGK